MIFNTKLAVWLSEHSARLDEKFHISFVDRGTGAAAPLLIIGSVEFDFIRKHF